ncbi:hypothetical protein AC578_9744 [Pseudocercospora eumusae]|uniref:Xylanolytic transcriptional activator regulatory domain-containing protein n=1 Tax=Pseudocercospora eumusae TaxID=321146 RepID=A0A139HQS7_9PEZI|nr:hypothetical protein AC578_9744 [Pseudocercospora eumusae]
MCLNAGVFCVALDAATNETAPRSIVKFLENQIALLEGQLMTLPGKDVKTWRPSIKSFQEATCSALSLGLTSNVPLAQCAISPTEIPVANKDLFGISDLDENHPRTILNPRPKQISISSIPLHIAEFLFRTYVQRIIPQYPIFHTVQVELAFDECFVLPGACVDAGEPSLRSLYIVSIIVAISLTTAARNKQARAQSIAASLVRSAMFYAPSVLTNDLDGLQCLLLLIQYTFLDPSVANLWLLAGLASEACIDLGLHVEETSSALSPLQLDLRRRIFWCAYEMEIAVCAGLQRPLRLIAADISASFPSQESDQAITHASIDTTGIETKFISRRIWGFRIIESSVLEMLYQDAPCLSEPALESWMEDVEGKILEWREEVHQSASCNRDPALRSQWDEIELYVDIAYEWILVLMYRPCPGLKARKREHLMKAFDAGVKVATGYFTQANRGYGFLKYVFHPCHHSFASAMVFLQALKYCKEEISDSYTLTEVREYLTCFSRFFSAIAERWPAAAHCLDDIQRLWTPIYDEYITFLRHKQQNVQLAVLTSPLESIHTVESIGDMADLFEWWPTFNPIAEVTGFATQNNPSSAVPYDWQAEFQFDADAFSQEFI